MRLVFSRAAKADIARKNPQAAARVAHAIEQAADRLCLFPYSGRLGAIEGTRELVVRGLTYHRDLSHL
jgi:plasmid stabilization system protein ParE